MRVLCYYFINSDDQRIFFSYTLSLVAIVFARSFLFALIFTSHPVTLGVMLDDQTYVKTCASACIP